jgi:hypothetical protein
LLGLPRDWCDRYTWREFHALMRVYRQAQKPAWSRASLIATSTYNAFGGARLDPDHFVPKDEDELRGEANLERLRAKVQRYRNDPRYNPALLKNA